MLGKGGDANGKQEKGGLGLGWKESGEREEREKGEVWGGRRSECG